MEFRNMSISELKKIYKDYWLRVYRYECYGVRDLLILDAIERELSSRGYVPKINQPTFVKEDN